MGYSSSINNSSETEGQSMGAYHISANGEPTPCKANVQSCPLGGEHFTTLEDAKAYVESEELLKNGGSFSGVFTKSQRKRMFHTNPHMPYSVNIDDSVYSQDGDEWVVISKVYGRTDGIGHTLPTIGLAKVPSGEEVILDPYDDESTLSISDFSLPAPAPIVLAGPPVRDSEKFKEFPLGLSTYNAVLLQTIPVKTTIDGDMTGRYLLVERARNGELLNDDEMLEVSEAMWKQTGKSLEVWHEMDRDEQLKYFRWHSTAHKRLQAENDGKEIQLSSFNDLGKPTPATEDAVPINDIARYSLTLD